MRILVTGAGGQLGHAVLRELLRRGHEAVGTVRSDAGAADAPHVKLDITDAAGTERVMDALEPEAVIHCAAWTAVDSAEAEENRGAVRAVNVGGTENIARACRAADARLLYISTDYVFNGAGTEPWQPDCRDFGPLNFYGETKLAGERIVEGTVEKSFIVRTSWVFGTRGNNFVRTMLRLGKSQPRLRVVDDQIGAPTYTPDLARLLADMIETERYGRYHATNEGGYISWYDFAREILRRGGCGAELLPVSTAEYGLSRAARPLNSRLDTGKLPRSGFCPLPHWQDALDRCWKEMEE